MFKKTHAILTVPMASGGEYYFDQARPTKLEDLEDAGVRVLSPVSDLTFEGRFSSIEWRRGSKVEYDESGTLMHLPGGGSFTLTTDDGETLIFPRISESLVDAGIHKKRVHLSVTVEVLED